MTTGSRSNSKGSMRLFLAALSILVVFPLVAGEAAAAESRGPVTEGDVHAAMAATKWIDVNLSTQMLAAYEGSRRVYSTRISSGTTKYPTVTGTFYIYAKLVSQRIRGGTGRDRYDLPGVPHVMYFHKGYAIHGTYWHNNFGRPMSHGCVNASRQAAAWLYKWAHNGTRVTVHY